MDEVGGFSKSVDFCGFEASAGTHEQPSWEFNMARCPGFNRPSLLDSSLYLTNSFVHVRFTTTWAA